MSSVVRRLAGTFQPKTTPRDGIRASAIEKVSLARHASFARRVHHVKPPAPSLP